MTYKTLIKLLRRQSKADGSIDKEVTILDVLDDLAVLGVDGASELYMREIKIWKDRQVKDIDTTTGEISKR